MQLHQQRLQGLQHLLLLDVQQGVEPVVPVGQRVQQRDGGDAGLGDGDDHPEQCGIFAASVNGGRFDQLQGDAALKEGAHHDDVEGADQQRHDQRRIVLAQTQQLLADDVGRHQAAAKDHGEEAEEIEEAAEFEVRTVQNVGVHGAHRGTQHRADARDVDGVKVGAPDLGQLIECVLVGVHAPADGHEGVADGGDGFLGREGNDDNEEEGNDAADGEQTDDPMEDRFGSHADAIQAEVLLFSHLESPLRTDCFRNRSS